MTEDPKITEAYRRTAELSVKLAACFGVQAAVNIFVSAGTALMTATAGKEATVQYLRALASEIENDSPDPNQLN